MKSSLRLWAVIMVLFATLGAKPSGSPNPYACPGGKSYPVHLTFDDGPHLVNTEKVLKILGDEHVPATFFVMGDHFRADHPQSKRNFEMLDQIRAKGHVIASHSYHHEHHPTLDKATIKNYVSKTNKLLKGYLSEEKYFRLPYGAGWFQSRDEDEEVKAKVNRKNQQIMSIVDQEQSTHVGWDIDSYDWDVSKRDTLVANMMKQICEKRGGVVLMHDIHNYTAEHLAGWIKTMANAGHRFVTLKDIQELNATSAVRPRPRLATDECESCAKSRTSEAQPQSRQAEGLRRDTQNLIKHINEGGDE